MDKIFPLSAPLVIPSIFPHCFFEFFLIFLPFCAAQLIINFPCLMFYFAAIFLLQLSHHCSPFLLHFCRPSKPPSLSLPPF
ncbi:hypothetical protein ES332_D11G175700v1 [Gossypium tomentosum]|uniref:Uncharacterized protein n=1 Tax=Gossypium tomentosum TaxID=34277 RepID=A0A5D2INM9_GOSTO|nr:hypothetical protein ES332_D11G175700v1 [Gossypium tomentosum]